MNSRTRFFSRRRFFCCMPQALLRLLPFQVRCWPFKCAAPPAVQALQLSFLNDVKLAVSAPRLTRCCAPCSSPAPSPPCASSPAATMEAGLLACSQSFQRLPAPRLPRSPRLSALKRQRPGNPGSSAKIGSASARAATASAALLLRDTLTAHPPRRDRLGTGQPAAKDFQQRRSSVCAHLGGNLPLSR